MAKSEIGFPFFFLFLESRRFLRKEIIGTRTFSEGKGSFKEEEKQNWGTTWSELVTMYSEGFPFGSGCVCVRVDRE